MKRKPLTTPYLLMDKEHDVGYLYLVDIKPKEVKQTVPIQGFEDINLDFDEKNRLIGIEFLNLNKRIRFREVSNCTSIQSK